MNLSLDEQMLANAKNGCKKSLDILLKEVYNDVYKAVKRGGVPRNDVDDVVQDTFTRTIKYLDKCNTNFHKWVLAVNTRYAILEYKANIDPLKESLDESEDEEDGYLDSHEAVTSDTEEAQRIRIANVLNCLTQQEQEVYELVVGHDYPQQKVASRLGVPLARIEYLLRVARNKIHDEVNNERD